MRSLPLGRLLPFRQLVERTRKRFSRKTAPLHGWGRGPHPIRFVDGLSDHDLETLNKALDWHAFVVDGRGRRFGAAAWKGKRDSPQPIPDPRIVKMNEVLDLEGKHVLEVGCFEGIHTVGLLQHAGRVTAIDSRIENVVKTIVRCAFFGYHPEVFMCDVEDPGSLDEMRADLVHHVGVLYHLRNPVEHLLELGRVCRAGILLDTHFSREEEATDTYTHDGHTYRYKRYAEGGRRDPFSGMYGHSKWLLLEDIEAILARAGFEDVIVRETREERNGPRVLLIARRSSARDAG